MRARQFQRFIFEQLGNLLDPQLCPGCAARLDHHQIFCTACRQRLKPINNPCRLCGLENQSQDDTCAACLYDPPHWQHLLTPFQYQGLTRELLMRFKFSESLYLANTLVKTAIHYFELQKPQPEVLLPVPLHHDRLMQRGYNQAFEIAQLLSRELNIKVDTQSLQRLRHTEAQAGLTAYAREKNILNAFGCRKPLGYQHVAVVDDIVTTGATANEITRVLHRAGVETIEIWALARAVK
ncbi:MAG: ComF family protein [Gammaproteobacteria bacterium]|nr:ComF family protein [Gammaproteobacteria bacterium]